MDLGVFLESPQGSQSLSRVGACTCAFLPSCSSSVTLPFPCILGSVAFPRGFPRGFPTTLSTVMSHVPPSCQSILGLKLMQCRENRLPWNGLRHLGYLGMVARLLSPSRLSGGERLLLRCNGNAGNLSRACGERIPPLELGGSNGAPLDVGGTLVLPLEWRRVYPGTC